MASEALIAQGEHRRQAILTYVREYSADKGWAPTISEIADAVGLGSPNSTRNHLARLVEDGYLRMEPKQARAIALIEPAPDGWTRPVVPPVPRAEQQQAC